MTFTFNTVRLYVVTINDKPWIRAREVCRALKFEKAARWVVRDHCTSKNIQHKNQLVVVPSTSTTVNCPRNSQKLDLYINEEWMYELLFSSQQPKTKDFRRHCCNVLFPHVRQQLTNKMEQEYQQAITNRDNIKTLHCSHKGICIRTSHKDVKIKSVTLLSIAMFLLQVIQVKITLLWLFRKTQSLKKMSFKSIPTILREYNDGLLAQKDNGLGHNIGIIDS